MGDALRFANQKLYHAAILTRMLSDERERERIPLSVLLEAVGEPARQHLQAAYGWFLVALAGPSELPDAPPRNVSDLVATFGLGDPLRGELVELRQLEASGWLAELLASASPNVGGGQRREGVVPLVAQAWDDSRLAEWRGQLEGLIDRLSHGLEEW